MAQSILGNSEAIKRMTIINSIGEAWIICNEEINEIKSELFGYMEDESIENFEWSYQALIQSINTLKDEQYIMSETPFLFNEIVDSLNVALKHLSMSYLVENNIEHRRDDVENLMQLCCDSLSDRYNNLNGQRIFWGYPAISKLIRFIRNLEEHQIRDRPRDVITNARSFGNVFTITSMFILSVHAYIEIIKMWLIIEQQSQESVPEEIPSDPIAEEDVDSENSSPDERESEE